jgi:hypothetical protein
MNGKLHSIGVMRRVFATALDANRPNPKAALSTRLCLSRDGNIELHNGKIPRSPTVYNSLGSSIAVHFSADVIAPGFFLRGSNAGENLAQGLFHEFGNIHLRALSFHFHLEAQFHQAADGFGPALTA